MFRRPHLSARSPDGPSEHRPSAGEPAQAQALESPVPLTVSSWSPFRHATFALLWTAMVASNVGTWMQNAAAGWLMTELSRDPLMVALVQTAMALPVFLFGFPAGALADIVDRRRLLLAVQLITTPFIVVFAVLVGIGDATPTTLLAITFVSGTAVALILPTWQAVLPQLVGREELASAVALNSFGVSVSRVIGPALDRCCHRKLRYGRAVLVQRRQQRPDGGGGSAVACRTGRVVRAPGGTYRPSDDRRSSACALQSRASGGAGARRRVLPVRRRLLGAAAGAVTGADWRRAAGLWHPTGGYRRWRGGRHLRLARLLRGGMNADRLVLAGSVGTAGATVLYAMAHDMPTALAASLLAGLCWIVVLATINVAAQASVPGWVRGRSLGVFAKVLFGSLTFGSVAWGQLASLIGSSDDIARRGGEPAAGNPVPLAQQIGYRRTTWTFRPRCTGRRRC